MGLRRKRREASDEPTAEELAVVSCVRAWGNQIYFGAPTRCPDCGDFGLVDRVDGVAGRCDNRCTVCGATWCITRRALRAPTPVPAPVVDEQVVPDPEPVAGGVLIDPLLTTGRAGESRPATRPAFG